MPAGDAWLEQQAQSECDFDPDHLYHNHREASALRAEVDRLQAQLAAQQAVVDAARDFWQVEPAVSVRSTWKDAHLRLADALRTLDAAQAAQPEGER